MSEFYIENPVNFGAELEVSTVFMECQGKLLLLHRAQCELSPETWGYLEESLKREKHL